MEQLAEWFILTTEMHGSNPAMGTFIFIELGSALHIVCASPPAAPSSNPGPVEIFSLLLSLWTVEKSNPSSAYARDFANAVQQRPKYCKTILRNGQLKN